MLYLRVTRKISRGASLVPGAVDDGVGGDGGRDAGDEQEQLHHRGEFWTDELSGASRSFLNAPLWGSRPPFRMRAEGLSD